MLIAWVHGESRPEDIGEAIEAAAVYRHAYWTYGGASDDVAPLRRVERTTPEELNHG